MRIVFADTSYWIAVWNPRDQLHQAAMDISESMGDIKMFTTQMVLAEVLNSLASGNESMRQRLADWVDQMKMNPTIEVLQQSDQQFREALMVYRQHSDNAWGLTDCASYAAMKNLRITEALTHDHDFEQMGFTALLRQSR
jgi:hypothetical protein